MRAISPFIRFILTLFIGLFAGSHAVAEACDPPQVLPDNLFPAVKLETSLGDIVIELDRRKAPITVNNFLRYVTSNRYDGTVFHRVIADFVVQGGGYDAGMNARPTYPAIFNESGNGLQNRQWTVAMARHDDPHSATSQFFFNLADNENLDPSSRNWGYTVFGTVIEGIAVIEQMAQSATGYNADLDATDVPQTPIVLRKAGVL